MNGETSLGDENDGAEFQLSQLPVLPTGLEFLQAALDGNLEQLPGLAPSAPSTPPPNRLDARAVKAVRLKAQLDQDQAELRALPSQLDAAIEAMCTSPQAALGQFSAIHVPPDIPLHRMGQVRARRPRTVPQQRRERTDLE